MDKMNKDWIMTIAGIDLYCNDTILLHDKFPANDVVQKILDLKNSLKTYHNIELINIATIKQEIK
jgi:Zn-finger protein